MSKDLPPLVKEVRINDRQDPKGAIDQPFHNVTFILDARASRFPLDESWGAFKPFSLVDKPILTKSRTTGRVTIRFPVSIDTANAIRENFADVLAVPSDRSKNPKPLADGEQIDEAMVRSLHAELQEVCYTPHVEGPVSLTFQIATKQPSQRRAEYGLAQQQLERLIAEQLKEYSRESVSPDGNESEPFGGLEIVKRYEKRQSKAATLRVTINGFEDNAAAEGFFKKLEGIDLLNNPVAEAEIDKPTGRGR